MTPAKQTILARMSDGAWRQGHEITRHGATLGALLNAGLLRCDNDHLPMYERFFTITPDGLNVVEAAQ